MCCSVNKQHYQKAALLFIARVDPEEVFYVLWGHIYTRSCVTVVMSYVVVAHCCGEVALACTNHDAEATVQ